MPKHTLVVVACSATVLVAASAADAQWSTLQIRKTFDGGKGEQQPAAVAYVNPPEGDHYLQVDVGVRLYEWLVENDKATLFFSPVAEYHRADAEPMRHQAAVDKASVGVAADTYFTQTPIGTPRVHATLALKRNLLKDQKEGALSFLGSVDWPPRPVEGNAVSARFRFVPFAGFEYFNNVAVTSSGAEVLPAFSDWTWTLRFYFEALLMRRDTLPGDARVSVQADGYFRRALDTARTDRNLPSVSVSATFWILDRRRLGIGYSFEVGQTPLSGFVSQSRSAVSLTFRVGG